MSSWLIASALEMSRTLKANLMIFIDDRRVAAEEATTCVKVAARGGDVSRVGHQLGWSQGPESYDERCCKSTVRYPHCAAKSVDANGHEYPTQGVGSSDGGEHGVGVAGRRHHDGEQGKAREGDQTSSERQGKRPGFASIASTFPGPCLRCGVQIGGGRLTGKGRWKGGAAISAHGRRASNSGTQAPATSA